MRRPSNDIRTAEEIKRLAEKLKIAEAHKPQAWKRQEKVIR